MKQANRILTLFAVLLAVALIAVPAEATCRAVVRKQAVVVKKEVVVAAATVVAPVVATFVPVPLYSAVYHPGYQAPAPQAQAQPGCDETMKQLAQILQQLDARLQRLEGGGKPGPAPAPMPPPVDPVPDPFNPTTKAAPASDDAVKLFVGKCASCHEASRAAASGGGFTLLSGGKLVQLSDKQVKDVLVRCYSDDAAVAMPRGGKPLTDQEFAVLMQWAGARK